jgi:hypothetical protein
MDKANKIRRYLRKDYTQVVQFPVEIIGRDGIVRRYSFEESIRLYQRRIASADIRYQDRELIQAEKQHCLHRIDQIRRSFFSHYGWPALQLVDTAATGPQALSAEVAAFLRRCLAYLDRDPELFTFSHLETTEEHQVYFIQPPVEDDHGDQLNGGHFLLYVFAFDEIGSCPKREAFFQLIKIMDSVYLGQVGAIESLVAFFHTHDCGLVLTGTGNVRQRAPKAHEIQELEISWPGEVVQHDPVEHAMRMLSRGQFKQALECFIAGYTEHHYRRVAYLGAAVVADVLGEDTEAETATVMGCRYFPGDAALVYHYAVNLARRGDFTEALRRLEEIEEWPRGKPAVSLLEAICLLLSFQQIEGKRRLRRVPEGSFRLDPHLSRAHKWVQRQLWTRDLIVALCAMIAFTGLALGVTQAEWGWLLVGLTGLVCIRVTILAWAHQLRSAICGTAEQRYRLSSSAILIESQSNEFLQ